MCVCVYGERGRDTRSQVREWATIVWERGQHTACGDSSVQFAIEFKRSVNYGIRGVLKAASPNEMAICVRWTVGIDAVT